MQPFYDFENGFRSSPSTADLLTVLSDRIARAFNRSGTTQAVPLDISMAFNRVWRASLLHKLLEFQVGYLSLFLLFPLVGGFGWFWMGHFLKNIQFYAGVPQGSILGPTLSYYVLMTFLMMLSVILLSMLMILLSALM